MPESSERPSLSCEEWMEKADRLTTLRWGNSPSKYEDLYPAMRVLIDSTMADLGFGPCPKPEPPVFEVRDCDKTIRDIPPVRIAMKAGLICLEGTEPLFDATEARKVIEAFTALLPYVEEEA